MKVRKAVIPAAGLGTRFLPATKAQPKEMLPIVILVDQFDTMISSERERAFLETEMSVFRQ